MCWLIMKNEQKMTKKMHSRHGKTKQQQGDFQLLNRIKSAMAGVTIVFYTSYAHLNLYTRPK